jgi:hypothetical protein
MKGTKFDLDKLWDKPEHPEYWYLGRIMSLMHV